MISDSDLLYLLMSRQPWHSLPQPFYGDADLYRADLRHIWMADWIFAAPSAELCPGRAITSRCNWAMRR